MNQKYKIMKNVFILFCFYFQIHALDQLFGSDLSENEQGYISDVSISSDRSFKQKIENFVNPVIIAGITRNEKITDVKQVAEELNIKKRKALSLQADILDDNWQKMIKCDENKKLEKYLLSLPSHMIPINKFGQNPAHLAAKKPGGEYSLRVALRIRPDFAGLPDYFGRLPEYFIRSDKPTAKTTLIAHAKSIIKQS